MTIQDLAGILGLGISTVSKALNGRSDVSESVRARVLAAAQEHGYVPNPQARRLAFGSSRMIGVFLLNRFGRPVPEYFGFNYLDGILAAADERGYDVVVLPESSVKEGEAFEAVARRRGLEGFILIGLHGTDQHAALLASRLPFISIDTPVPQAPRGLVASDNRDGQRAIAAWALAQGSLRPCYFGMRGEGWVARERRQGFLDALSELGRSGPAWLETVPLRLDTARQAARDALAAAEPPDLIVCATDLQALGVIQAARELGVACPRDLMVTGFDDIHAASLSSPGLSTWRQDSHAIGRAAFERLLAPPDPAPLLVPGSLCIRDSTRNTENPASAPRSCHEPRPLS